MKKIMIIGVGWEQLPLVYKAKQMGLNVVATTQWNGDIPADKVYKVDSCDLLTLEAIYLKEKPDGIIADECDYSMYAVAYLTEKYGHPGPGLSALTITNNKILQRELASRAGIPQPNYQKCWCVAHVWDFVHKFGYPIVIKPTDNRGSIGVSVVNDDRDVESAFYTALASSRNKLCIVEEYKAGNVVTVDGYCDGERFYSLAVGTKDTYHGTTSVAKTLYYPGKIDCNTQHQLYQYCEEMVKSIGIVFGFVHAEFIVNREENQLWFVEIANRGGGVFISDIIIPNLYHFDFISHLIHMSLGVKKPVKLGKISKKTIMYFMECSGESTPETVCHQYLNILGMHLSSGAGHTEKKVSDARDRKGVVLLTGDDFDSLIHQAKQIESEIRVQDEFTFMRV